jgi:hypothetical protein
MEGHQQLLHGTLYRHGSNLAGSHGFQEAIGIGAVTLVRRISSSANAGV